MKFACEAVDAVGVMTTDVIEADSEELAHQKVRQLGRFVTRIQPLDHNNTCGKQGCGRVATWKGIVGNLNVVACDGHKDDPEIGLIGPLNTADSDSDHPAGKLLRHIQRLHDAGAFHVKRGFSLKETTPLVGTNHLAEEVLELQAEACISLDREKTLDEFADTINVALHLMVVMDVTWEQLLQRGLQRLGGVFTLDPAKIKTDTPGFTRRNRK